MKRDPDIKHIAPAQDWFVIFKEEGQRLFLLPIACWVTVADGDADFVTFGWIVPGQAMQIDDQEDTIGCHRSELKRWLKKLYGDGWRLRLDCFVDIEALGLTLYT